MALHGPTQLELFPVAAALERAAGMFSDAIAELRAWRRRNAALYRYGRNR